MIIGAGGNDNLSLNETNGALPGAALFGGDGNDVLIGGSGDDFVDGGAGNDIVFLGAGDDTFQWNPGDGSDTVDGQGGSDTMVFNGSDAAENFDISANGNRVRFTRDVGNVTMDLDGVETIDLNALGGADIITVNDQSATDLSTVNLDLAGTAGIGDGQADSVIVNGTDGDDFVQIAASDNGTSIVAVAGLFPMVNITGAEGTNDNLTVNALGGNDMVDASNLPANLIGLVLNGGAGNDTILGSPGDDLVIGGPGDDLAQLGDGDDTFVWNPGDGSDTVDGQGGSDRMVFNGSDASENFGISANGNRVRLTRDVGGVTMDLDGVETIDLNALGGADTITVNDLTGDRPLRGQPEPRQLRRQSATARPTPSSSTAPTATTTSRSCHFGNGTRDRRRGPVSLVNITGAEGTNDHLTVNALGGNDMVDASYLPANLIGLTVNLGDGQCSHPRKPGCWRLRVAGRGHGAVPVSTRPAHPGRSPAAPAWRPTAAASPPATPRPGGHPGRLPPEDRLVQPGRHRLGRRHLPVSFQAAQRANYQASQQDFRVLVDGVVVGTFTPSGTGYSATPPPPSP